MSFILINQGDSIGGTGVKKENFDEYPFSNVKNSIVVDMDRGWYV
jgi:hypothetical protein